MPHFSEKSLAQLNTCHADLRRLFLEAVKGFDCTVLEGKRSEAQQRANVAKGVSKTMQSKHVYPLDGPALAVDVAPYPLNWPSTKSKTYLKDVAMFYCFGGYVMGVAEQMGIDIRWGGDWDGDWALVDQTFDDLPHFELRTP